MGEKGKEATAVAVASEGSEGSGELAKVQADALPEAKPVSLRKLFKFADGFDMFLIILGTLGAAGQGVALPMFSIILGGLLEDFQDPSKAEQSGEEAALLFGLIGVGVTVAAGLQVGCFTVASERQTLRIRKRYLDAVLRQEIAFFDHGSGELSSSIAENTVVIREAMGEKLGMLIQFGTMFFAGFGVGFAIDWRLTLVVVAVTPLLAGGGYVIMKFMADATSGGLGAYAKAGGVAEEAFSMVHTIMSFGLQKRLKTRYETDLAEAEKLGIKKSLYAGLGMGVTMGVYFCTYGLAFWFGAKLVNWGQEEAAALVPPDAGLNPKCAPGQTIEFSDNLGCLLRPGESFIPLTDADVCNCFACNCGCGLLDANCFTGGDVLRVFFAVVIGAMSLGQGMPSITALNNGRAAAAKIFALLDREPLIDAASDEGEKPASLDGHIRLTNVNFCYPTRPEVEIFSRLNLEIKPGQTVALVGGSGCGKSTVTQLVQRFYDPDEGTVSLDGHDLRDLNIKWLRSKIGLVGQEPVLFAATIAENISYGAPQGHKVTREEIEAAARAANAFDFVQEFPKGFDTFVGEAGSSLSGGQKQRIAIARAMIRDPNILILDEATSALDNESERIVQAALDDLLKQRKRTTIVIAHRLTTVRNADKIVVLGRGGVLEQGTHDELVAKKAHYSALLAAANKAEKKRSSAKRTSSKRFEAEADLEDASDEVDTAEEEEEAAEAEVKPAGRLSRRLSSKKKQKTGKADSDTSSELSSEEEEARYKVPLRRIFKYSAQEKLVYLPAVLSSIVNGVQLPLFAILFAGIANVYFVPTGAEIQEGANQYALYFVIFSIVAGVANFGQQYAFGIIGERMTTRVRASLFQALLRQDMGFFDEKKNSVGALTSRLATDAALVKASLADRLGLVVMNLTTVVSGLTIAFYYGWKLTLVLLGLLPIMVISGAVQMVAMGGLAKKDDESLSNAGQIMTESISGIRTVTAFAMRERVVGIYDAYLDKSVRLAVRKGVIGGSGMGLSQGTIFVVYAIAFWYGGRLISDPEEDYDSERVFNVFFAVVMMGVGMGQSAALAPDVAKAGVAISNVFRIIDRESPIDPEDEAGAKDEAVTSEDIELTNVDFSYPTRPDAKVFNDLSLKIRGGTTVAFVGQSGSGKSTAIQLLERFYDPSAGEVKYHGVNVREANISWLRRQYGYVAQEPHLFETTVFENIANGVPDEDIGEDGFVTEERVIAAAKAANAHDFISELPDGYQTMISKGTLSGGQKQRIALARCVIREPKVLLLDEATAALDNESEKIVQRSLDQLMDSSGKTTIVVAHRLSTIQNADVICVVHQGRIIEKGTHAELLAKGAAYAKLWRSQK